MTEPRILTEHELSGLERYLTHGLVGPEGNMPRLVATVRHWHERATQQALEAHEFSQDALEALRRAKAAEERCEELSEALGSLVDGRNADYAAARALLEEA